MKTYVLTISKVFPKTHVSAGRPTGFAEKIASGEKIHTIRGNYELWRKRFDQIEAGKACLSVREWEGKPYASKQVKLFEFHNESGIGLEKLDLDIYKSPEEWIKIAKNDGLLYVYFQEWFKYAGPEPMAIIHFTSFRYDV